MLGEGSKALEEDRSRKGEFQTWVRHDVRELRYR
jgi:hypothetical protein